MLTDETRAADAIWSTSGTLRNALILTRLLHKRFVVPPTEDLPSEEKDLMLLLMLTLGYSAAVHNRAVLHVRKNTVGWNVQKENVGFIALVRVQAVILLCTYLMHYFLLRRVYMRP